MWVLYPDQTGIQKYWVFRRQAQSGFSSYVIQGNFKSSALNFNTKIAPFMVVKCTCPCCLNFGILHEFEGKFFGWMGFLFR